MRRPGKRDPPDGRAFRPGASASSRFKARRAEPLQPREHGQEMAEEPSESQPSARRSHQVKKTKGQDDVGQDEEDGVGRKGG